MSLLDDTSYREPGGSWRSCLQKQRPRLCGQFRNRPRQRCHHRHARGGICNLGLCRFLVNWHTSTSGAQQWSFSRTHLHSASSWLWTGKYGNNWGLFCPLERANLCWWMTASRSWRPHRLPILNPIKNIAVVGAAPLP